MRKLLSIVLAGVMSLSLIACGSSSESKSADNTETDKSTSVSTKHLTLDITQSDNSTMHQGALKFAELVEQYTEGRYAVDVYTNAALGSGSQLTSTEMTQKGTIDMVLTSTAILGNMDSNFYIFDMPWLIKDLDWVDEHLVAGTNLFNLASAKAEGIGFKLLAFAELGYREFTNNKHTVEEPEDMKGLKVRSPGAIGLAAYELLGCNPTSIDFGELYTAMQQGAVDGEDNPIDGIIVPNKFYEVQKYITVWNFQYCGLPLAMNLDLWNSIPAEDQEAIMKAATEGFAYQKQLTRESYDTSVQTMIDYGCEVTVLTQEQKDAFKAAVEPMYAEYFAQIDDDLLAEFGVSK